MSEQSRGHRRLSDNSLNRAAGCTNADGNQFAECGRGKTFDVAFWNKIWTRCENSILLAGERQEELLEHSGPSLGKADRQSVVSFAAVPAGKKGTLGLGLLATLIRGRPAGAQAAGGSGG